MWVLYELMKQRLMKQMSTRLKFLTLYKDVGDYLFDYLVTDNETLVHDWTPFTKHTSMQWRMKDKKYPASSKKVSSVGKLMVTIFWDQQGILLVEYYL